MASTLSEREKELAREFVAAINEDRRRAQLDGVSFSESVKFLMARKFDLSRAIELFWSYHHTKAAEKLYSIDPCNENIAKELLSEKLTILGRPDPEGSAIALFTAKRHEPSSSNQHVTLQALFWQLDAALNRIETQRNGLVFIYDMTGAKFANFSYDLSDRVLRLLKGSFPARLKKVLIVQPPMWFKAPFNILRVFLREKLRDRVYTMDDANELAKYIGEAAAQERLSSSASAVHKAWLATCLLEHGLSEQACAEFFRSYDHRVAQLGLQATTHLASKAVQSASSRSTTSLASTDSRYTLAASSFTGVPSSSLPPPPPTSPPPPPPALPPVVTSFQVINAQQPQYTVPSVHQVSAEISTSSTGPTAAQMRSSLILTPSFTNSTQSSDGNLEPRRQASASELECGKTDNYYISIHNTDPGSSLTPLELVERVRRLRRLGLFQEYAAIKAEPLCGTFNAAKDRANAGKNRYTDVLCYDHSRVILEVEGSDPSSDYINASYTDGYKHRNAYICTMGPTPKTFNDFWRMVWQEHSRTIVMTTKTAEKGRVKCGQYWPLEGHMATDSFDIINTGVESKGDYDVTSLQVTHRNSGHTRTVTHFLFLSWPDYGIPSSPDGFLKFLEDVREVQAKATENLGDSWKGHPEGPPIIAHCSAGIGRTGTFLTVDICLRQLDETGRTNIHETVRRVRTQRAFSIQMPDQYLFCHLAIIEYARLRSMINDVDDLGNLVSDEGN